MILTDYFAALLSAIEPKAENKKEHQAGHKALREHLRADAEFSQHHINTFLQGSYKRNTAIAPGKDVDIVVVTSLDPEETTPRAALAMLKAALLRKYAAHEIDDTQTRSIGIKLPNVELDAVIAASPEFETVIKEAARTAREVDDLDAWIDSPLLIPDRDLNAWVPTDPKRQLEATTELNKASGLVFVPTVKLFKSWRRVAYTDPRRPKGYLLERLAGECFNTSATSHAQAFTELLESIVDSYGELAANEKPELPDYGVPEHDVFGRLDPSEFASLMQHVRLAAVLARAALDETDKKASIKHWQDLFGTDFPGAPESQAYDASFPPVPVRPNKPAGFA